VGDDGALGVEDERVVGLNVRLVRDDVEGCAEDFVVVERPREVFRVDDGALGVSASEEVVVGYKRGWNETAESRRISQKKACTGINLHAQH